MIVAGDFNDFITRMDRLAAKHKLQHTRLQYTRRALRLDEFVESRLDGIYSNDAQTLATSSQVNFTDHCLLTATIHINPVRQKYIGSSQAYPRAPVKLLIGLLPDFSICKSFALEVRLAIPKKTYSCYISRPSHYKTAPYSPDWKSELQNYQRHQ